MRRRELLQAGLAGAGSLVAGCGTDPSATTDSPTDETASQQTRTRSRAQSTPSPTRAATVTVAADPTVRVATRSFTPRRLRVTPGTEVTWHNVSSTTHSVESAQFNPVVAREWSYYSMDLVSGRRASHTFSEPGIYEYNCGVHGADTMCGVVIVGDRRYEGSLPCE